MGSIHLVRRGVMAASGGAVAACVVMGVASPAFAHSAGASVTQTCINGASSSKVVFTNDFDIPATLTYASRAAGSLNLLANGSASVTVAVPAPGQLTYTVRWEDGVTQGSRSVPLQPINDCMPVASTTAETLGVTLVPFPTTTVPPAAVEVAPTTPAVLSPSLPVASAGVPEETPSSAQNLPTAIQPPRALPATGSGSAVPIAVAAGLLVVGAVLIAGRRWPDKA